MNIPHPKGEVSVNPFRILHRIQTAGLRSRIRVHGLQRTLAGGVLNRPPPPEGSLREGLQLHVHHLFEHGDEGAVFGKVDRVGVIRFDARDSPAAAGRIAAAGGSRFSGLRNLHFEPA